MSYISIQSKNSIKNKDNPFSILVKKDNIILKDINLFQNSTDFNWIKLVKDIKDKNIYLMIIAKFTDYFNIPYERKSKIKKGDRYHYEVRNQIGIIESGIKENLYIDQYNIKEIGHQEREDISRLKDVHSLTTNLIENIDYNPRKNKNKKGYLMSIIKVEDNVALYEENTLKILKILKVQIKDER